MPTHWVEIASSHRYDDLQFIRWPSFYYGRATITTNFLGKHGVLNIALGRKNYGNILFYKPLHCDIYAIFNSKLQYS